MRKKFLASLMSILIMAGLMLVMYPFLQSLSPTGNSKVMSDASLTIDVNELEPGVVYLKTLKGIPIIILKPNDIQRASIESLNASVAHVEYSSYLKEYGVFIYEGIGIMGGRSICAIEHKPPRETPWGIKEGWLGGYWGKYCEISYDYAGRAINVPEHTFNGLYGEFENLPVPKVTPVSSAAFRVTAGS